MLESLFNKDAGHAKEAPIQVFSCEICKIFKNIFFNRTTLVAVSALPKISTGLVLVFLLEHLISKAFDLLLC